MKRKTKRIMSFINKCDILAKINMVLGKIKVHKMR